MNHQQPFIPLLLRLWVQIDHRRRVQLGLLFVLMVIASMLEMIAVGAVLPFLSVLAAPDQVFAHPLALPVINALGLTKPEELLMPLTAFFMMAVLFSGTVRVSLLWLQTRLSFAVGADISRSIYLRTLYQPYAVHVARNSSQVISAITMKAKYIIINGIVPIMNIASAALLSTAVFSALLAIDPLITLMSSAGLILIYLLIIVAGKSTLARDSREINVALSQVVKALQEGLGGIRDVLIDGTQPTYVKIYAEADGRMRRAQANSQIIGGSPRFLVETLGMLFIAGIGYSLASNSEGFVGAIPYMGVLVLGAQRILPSIHTIYSNLTALRSGQATLQDTLELLDQPLPYYSKLPAPAGIPFDHSIALEKVSFRYTASAPWVLRDISLVIPKGSRVGIVGSTGCGKSTLLDLVMGLLYPTEGRMTVDGVAVTEINQRSWQKRIAHVPQDIFLADATIAENIAFGIPLRLIDFEGVRQAAEIACIAETIETWPKKYETRVGERGVQISGGQRQRIGIARAIYKQADVIFFDEATSALDIKTEKAVSESLQILNCELTIFIVAHRISSLAACDVIIELEKGRIKRHMTYEELIFNPKTS
jgi:ATP-binding cassette subfamily B protein